MSWLVAAMAAGVLVGDILTGIELSTGAGEGRGKAQHCKKEVAPELNFGCGCARGLSCRDLAGLPAGARVALCELRLKQPRECQGECRAIRRHFQISRAIGGILNHKTYNHAATRSSIARPESSERYVTRLRTSGAKANHPSQDMAPQHPPQRTSVELSPRRP